MLCFVTLKVRESCKAARAPPQTPLAVVGVSRHAITFPPHLNPRSASDLAKRKGTPSYPCIRCQTQEEVVGFGHGQTRRWPPPPPPPPPPSIRIWPNSRRTPPRIWPNAKGEWSWAGGGGGGGGAPLVHFVPGRPTPSLRHCQNIDTLRCPCSVL